MELRHRLKICCLCFVGTTLCVPGTCSSIQVEGEQQEAGPNVPGRVQLEQACFAAVSPTVWPPVPWLPVLRCGKGNSYA